MIGKHAILWFGLLSMATVLLEIGTEEVPASYMPPALAQLYALAQTRFETERIAFESLSTWGTPRRITLYVTGVAEQQAPAVREVRGPTVQAAFAINGEPTQAATGFARSQGIPVNELRIKQIDNGEYVVAIFRDEGRPTAELLPAIFSELITGLTFPKTMRWGAGAFRFARPIRWLVSLMDEQVIPLTIADVTAGRLTRGHRFLSSGEVEVPSAAEYHRIMEENQVIVVPDDRREAISVQLDAIAQQEGAVVLDDGSLLDETTFHLEFPTAVRCNFDAQFLTLPTEVLQLVLKREQAFFPLTSETGELLPAFIGVRNGDKAYLGTVRDGYESVARAKLIDALFFYEQDTRVSLADRVEALNGVVFLERLGTMHDKVMRLQAIVDVITGRLGFTPTEHALIRRAALLSKADLVTAMVMEHPELQGVMGAVYARLSGETEEVATAIGEQYRPRSASDRIPATPAGQVVALADKMDTVTACFALGLIPTGSEDPYGLRRDAQGIVRILAEANYRLSLTRLINLALAELPAASLLQPCDETLAAIGNYLRQRVEGLLTQSGAPYPVVQAVMAVSADVPADAIQRARVLRDHLDDPALAGLARVATRLTNISKNFTDGEVMPDLFTEPAEQDLYRCYLETEPQAIRLTEQGDFAALFDLLTGLIPAIDNFFSDIMVMVDDPDLRQTRLALVWRLANLFRLLGDLTQIS